MQFGEINASRLAAMPTGSQLCAQLASVELGAVPDTELLAVLTSQARQLAYQQAQVWATMDEVARREPMPNAVPCWTPDQIFDSAVDEIRAELLLTRRGARRELDNAATVCSQPLIFQALQRGELDRSRAMILADGCLTLAPEQAAALIDRLLPEAATRTATSLAERVRKFATALDPRWAENRYRAAVRERRMIGYLNPDGSATVSAQCLPAEQAAAACDRVDALAGAAKLAGANAPLDHLRTELFLGLLDGRFHHLSQPQIIAALCALFGPAVNATEPAPECAPTPLLGVTRGVELKVELGTLLGLDERPGEIAGWGTITAATAHRIAARQHRSQWRFAVVDDDGRLICDGITRARPRDHREATQCAGGIVELHVAATLLKQPDMTQRHPAWAAVLADMAAQFATQRPIEQDPNARFAGKPLRRRSQLNFQRCIFPGCRRPASDCDIDHRHDHARGGRTDEENLAPGCRHDHMNKTTRGWRLIRIDEHTYRWISPLGRKHTVHIEPIAAPLPAPIPRTRQRVITVPTLEQPGPTFKRLTERGRPLIPCEREAPESDSDPPPF